MATKVEFNVSDEQHEAFLRKYKDVLQEREPEEGGAKITLSDAALAIFSAGVSRVRATTKYGLRQSGKLAPYKKPEKKAKPAPKPKAAKPAPTKKTAAKGPLARKQASKAKAPKIRKARVPASENAVVAAAAEPVLD